MKPVIRISIIGCGQVGQCFAYLLGRLPQYQIVNFYSRRVHMAQKAKTLAGGRGDVITHLSALLPADLYCISVNDDQISTVASALATHFASCVLFGENSQMDTVVPYPIAFHCSGAHASNVLSCLLPYEIQIGSIHPALNIHDPVEGAAALTSAYCTVEGSSQAVVQALSTLVVGFGATPVAIAVEQKCLYHAACVFMSNFSFLMVYAANLLLEKTGVPLSALLPLLQHTVAQAEAVVETESAEKAAKEKSVVALRHQLQARFTGPAARREYSLMQTQQASIHTVDPTLAILYRLCSEKIVQSLLDE